MTDRVNTVTICVEELDDRHTSEYLSRCLTKICSQWQIPHEKITAVVTDNGKNIVKAVQDTLGKSKHLPCFAHTLDLVATNIIGEAEQVKQIIDKVKTIVRYFKQSVNVADELRSVQGTCDEGIYRLIQSAPTRWNSNSIFWKELSSCQGLLHPF